MAEPSTSDLCKTAWAISHEYREAIFAEPDQFSGGTGEGGKDRARPEHRQADQEGAPAPGPVAQAAEGYEQTGEHDRVAVHDPLQLAVAGMELAHQRRQRHVEDRVVQCHQQKAEAQDHQNGPLAPPGVCGLRSRGLVQG